MASVPPPPTEPLKDVPLSGDPKSETGLVFPTLVDDPNPGSYEELHKKCKEVFPVPFEGARISITKGLSSVFQISHTLTMSSLQPSGYRFGCAFAGENPLEPNAPSPLLNGDMDFSGGLNAQIIHQFSKAIRCRFVTQVQSCKWIGNQFAAEYRGSDYTTTFSLLNIDPRRDAGVVLCNYLQNVTNRLALGTELMYQRDANIPGGQVAALSFGARYTGNTWQLGGNFSPLSASLKMCFYKKASNTVQFGVELDGSVANQECTTTIAYQIDLPKADVVFRGQVDSNFSVAAVMEKKLPPLPITFTLSGIGNHVKNTFRFGIGFSVGN